MSDLQDEIARTLAEHQPSTVLEDANVIGWRCGPDCEWGAEGGYGLDDWQRRHLADALAAAVLPLFEREARRREAAAVTSESLDLSEYDPADLNTLVDLIFAEVWMPLDVRYQAAARILSAGWVSPAEARRREAAAWRKGNLSGFDDGVADANGDESHVEAPNPYKETP